MLERHVNPEMLTLARESRGLTQTDLAQRIGVTQGKVSKYENGLLAVAEDDLATIGDVLAYPTSFFLQEDARLGSGTLCRFYRKRRSLPMQQLKQIEAKINILRLQLARLLKGASIEAPLKFPRMDLDEYGTPEQVAGALRTAWNLPLGPIKNLVASIESAGGIVLRCTFGTPKIDAVSMWPMPLPPLFFINLERPADRIRFTLAHEVGHLVMHEVPSPNEEEEADRFASEFLMPAKAVKPDLNGISLERAAALKPYWRVSMAALIKRAYDLDVIPERRYRYLFTQLSRQGFRTEEPVTLPHETPSLVREIIQVHRTELGYSVQQLGELLCLREDEVRTEYDLEQPQGRNTPPIRLV